MRGLRSMLAASAVAAALAGCNAAPGRAPEPAPDERPSRGSAYDPAATAEIDLLDAAIQRFAHDRAGRLPVSLDELEKERSPDGISYVRGIDRDPWGRAYSYTVTSPRAGSYDLRSYGPDRLPGTDDDLVARAEPVMPK